MVKGEVIHLIHEKALEGKTAYRIGKELGISKNTAKAYIASGCNENARYPKRQSKLDAFKSEIDSLISQGVLNCVVILEHIKKMGYGGKITILKNYVRPFRKQNSSRLATNAKSKLK